MPKSKLKKLKKLVRTFHVFCEGEKTEPYYIKGYISYFHSENRNIILVEDTKKNTPVQLVEEAVCYKKRSLEGDEFWVVFDRESTAKYSHKLHLNAMALAKKNKIKIAISNVCFEFWLLLHLEYTTASYESCDDLLARSLLKTRLREKGLEDYDKGCALLFDTLKDGFEDAVRNAKRVKVDALKTAEHGKECPCYLNPYTDVHELFIGINNFIKEIEE